VDAFLEALHSQATPEKLTQLTRVNRLVAGTSHSFQGDERDHIILSLALDDHSPEGAWRFARREDVFNVAITRSRESMKALTSFNPQKRPHSCLLRKFVSQKLHLLAPQQDSRLTSLGDLADTLQAIGWKPLPKKTLAGIPVDLLICRNKQLVAIDLIATAGEEGKAVPLSRALILQRSGVPLIPIRLDEWLHRKNDLITFFNNTSFRA